MKHYRHRITIEALTNTPDQYGGEVGTWAEVVTIWAKVEPQEGGESFESGEVSEVARLQIETWHRSDINAKCRIKYGGRTFEIDSIQNVKEENRKLLMMVREVR
jgi:SPP1 family predicted phage head-tail adaptor